MGLKGLIANQTIRIDDHHWGSREVKNWDDQAKDIHIDKSTNTRVGGRRQKVQIRIPINSDRSIRIGNKNKQFDSLPRELEREIRQALEDRQIRDAFVRELITTLRNFPSALDDETKAKAILDRLSRHFDLEWTGQRTATYAREALQYYAQLYTDDVGLIYFLTIDKRKIEIGQNNGFAKVFKRFPR